MAELSHTSNFSGEYFHISLLMKVFLCQEEERKYLLRMNFSLRKVRFLRYLLKQFRIKTYSFQKNLICL